MSGLAILSTSFVLICKWSDFLVFSGKVGKLQFPSNETSSEKPLHGTHVPTFAESSRFFCRHQGGHVHTDGDGQEKRTLSFNKLFFHANSNGKQSKSPCHVARFRHKPAFHCVSSLRR